MQERLLPEIESIAFELPGRSDRFSEKFVQNLEAAVDDIYRQLIQQLPEEYCIIGNSMGSIIGFLLTHKLKQENKPLPKHLFQNILKQKQKILISKITRKEIK